MRTADKNIGDLKDADPCLWATPQAPNAISPTLRFALGVVFLIVVLGVWLILLFMRREGMENVDWAAFYVLTGVMTGMAFWLLTTDPAGEYVNSKLGIKLGGGAAIGMAFMIVANLLTSSHRSAGSTSDAKVYIADAMRLPNGDLVLKSVSAESPLADCIAPPPRDN